MNSDVELEAAISVFGVEHVAGVLAYNSMKHLVTEFRPLFRRCAVDAVAYKYVYFEAVK